MSKYRRNSTFAQILMLSCVVAPAGALAGDEWGGTGNDSAKIIRIASTNSKPITRLKGLADGEGCAFAKGRGTVESVEMDPSGKDIGAFWYKDTKFGRSYVNVILEGKNANSKVRRALAYLLQPGNVLEIGTYGCGAAARIEMLASVKLLKLAKGR